MVLNKGFSIIVSSLLWDQQQVRLKLYSLFMSFFDVFNHYFFRLPAFKLLSLFAWEQMAKSKVLAEIIVRKIDNS